MRHQTSDRRRRTEGRGRKKEERGKKKEDREEAGGKRIEEDGGSRRGEAETRGEDYHAVIIIEHLFYVKR